MSSKAGRWGLWISTLLILVLVVVQGWSGNWTVFFGIWPVKTGTYTSSFMNLVSHLTSYHMKMGFGIGGLGIIAAVFAFLGRSSIYVRVLSIAGVALAGLAADGGYKFVHSAFQDQMSLGQMADSFLGVIVVYFVMLFFINRTPAFPWQRTKT